MILCLNICDIAFITVKGCDYCCIIHDIYKSDAIICLMIMGTYKMHIKEVDIKNRVFNYYNDN